MAALYLFSLILGGGFLVLSLLGGEGEGDLELDAGDIDVDFDAIEGDVGDVGDAGDGAASRIFSIRTVVYTLFGFGATGTALTQLGLGFVPTLAFSIVGGIASGLFVSLVFQYLVRTSSGVPPGDDSLVGLLGTVTISLGGGTEGTVVVHRDGRRISLRALPQPSLAAGSDPETWKDVVIVEVEGGIVRVAPLDADELDALGSGEPSTP
ncbi:MAG: NfeD family protein [Gemmatimonadetes bacterium]|nr:NfeD family protein [Gemmatimonadota bacterium]NNK64367.1 NfeD family protein [Gemmatimonadota bacterium]